MRKEKGGEGKEKAGGDETNIRITQESQILLRIIPILRSNR
jgi:hypothetical protein